MQKRFLTKAMLAMVVAATMLGLLLAGCAEEEAPVLLELEAFTDEAGISWLVLAERDGARLVITEHVHALGTRFHDTNAVVELHEAEIQSSLDAFLDEIGADMRDVALSDGLFFLSLAEVTEYFGFIDDDMTDNPNAVARCVDGTARRWWLRSPGGTTTPTMALVHTNGARQHTTADNAHSFIGIRPAMWVSVEG